jgi:hypothetical protein
MNREQFIKDVIEVGHMDNVYLVSNVTLLMTDDCRILCCPLGAAYYKDFGNTITDEKYPQSVFDVVRRKYNVTKEYTDGIIDSVDNSSYSNPKSNHPDYQQAVRDVCVLSNIFTFKV